MLLSLFLELCLNNTMTLGMHLNVPLTQRRITRCKMVIYELKKHFLLLKWPFLARITLCVNVPLLSKYLKPSETSLVAGSCCSLNQIKS